MRFCNRFVVDALFLVCFTAIMAQIFLKDEKLYLMIINNNNLREMIFFSIQKPSTP